MRKVIIQFTDTNEQIEYRHKIEPIKRDGAFVPNYAKLQEIIAQSKINIMFGTFTNVQAKGETILVNEAGGWRTLTDKMKIVSE